MSSIGYSIGYGNTKYCGEWSNKRESTKYVLVSETVEVTDSWGNQISWATSFTEGSERACEGCTSSLVVHTGDEIAFTRKNSMITSFTSAFTGGTKRFLYEVNDNYFDGVCYSTWNCETALTGIVDEEGNRYATWEYMQFEGTPRAFVSYHGTGSDVEDYMQIDYPHGYSRIAKNAADREQTLTFKLVNDSIRLEKVTGSGGTNCVDSSFDYVYTGDRIETIFQNKDTDFEQRFDYMYDQSGRVRSITHGKGTPTERQVDYNWVGANYSRLDTAKFFENGRLYKSIDYGYHPNGRLNNIVERDAFAQSEAIINVEYDFWDSGNTRIRQITVDGPREDVSDITTYEYNNKGLLISITNSAGHTKTFSDHNATGNPQTLIDERGERLYISYKHDGAKIGSIESDLGRIADFEYFKTGRLREIELARGEVYNYSYTSAGLLEAIKDQYGNSISHERAPLPSDSSIESVLTSIISVETSIVQSGGTATSSQSLERVYQSQIYLDALGRLYKQFNADIPNYEFTFDYTPSNKLRRISNSEFMDAEVFFDSLGRIYKKLFETGDVEKYQYQVDDLFGWVTDANGLATFHANHAYNNLSFTISPDSGVSSSKYDSAGNTVIGYQQGSTTAIQSIMEYDQLNRLVSIEYPTWPYENTVLTWDVERDGELYSIDSGFTSTTFKYQDNYLRRIKSKKISFPSHNISAEVVYEEDFAGNLVSISYPSGRKISFDDAVPSAKNPNGNFTSIRASGTPGGSVVLIDNIKYLPFGPAKAWHQFNGYGIEVDYGLDYQIDRLRINNREITYDYNAQGFLKSISDSASNARSEFQYDTRGRISKTSSSRNGTLTGSTSFDFDPNGNATLWQASPGGAKSIQLADTKNQVTYFGDPSIGYIGYDSQGRTTHYTTVKANAYFQYSARGRLEKVRKPQANVEVSFVYNALGERASKATKYPGGSTTTYYLYGRDGELLSELDKAGQVQREYVYWDGRLIFVIDNRPGVGNFGQGYIYFVHSNYLGAPVELTDIGGDVVWRAEYEPFGGVNELTDPDGDGEHMTLNVRFPGQYEDRETGLYYNYYRYYDPRMGRYITPDPIGLAGGMNPYLYAGGNPINYIDPLGLFRFGTRPLGGLPFMMEYGGNVNLLHEHGFYDGGGDIGYFPEGIGPDAAINLSKYHLSGPYYDDIIREAVSRLRDSGSWNPESEKDPFGYDLLKRNCQDFSDALRHEYDILGGELCKTPFSNGNCLSEYRCRVTRRGMRCE